MLLSREPHAKYLPFGEYCMHSICSVPSTCESTHARLFKSNTDHLAFLNPIAATRGRERDTIWEEFALLTCIRRSYSEIILKWSVYSVCILPYISYKTPFEYVNDLLIFGESSEMNVLYKSCSSSWHLLEHFAEKCTCISKLVIYKKLWHFHETKIWTFFWEK